MAGVAETSLEVLVGLRQPGPVTAELVYQGAAAGVARKRVADWSAQESAVSASVTFGPVVIPVTFDAVRLYHAGELLVDLPRTSPLRLDPGESYTQDVEISGAVT